MSQAIICDHTDKIALYNKSDTDCCADSGASEDMWTDYSTFKTYLRLSNCYATLGDTKNLHIEGIVTAVYRLNRQTILTRNSLHNPSLCSPIYSLLKHRQRPGCGVKYSYKNGSYLFFPDFIIQVEEWYDNIFIWRTLGRSHQGPIDYIEPKYTWYRNMATPSGRPSTITPAHNPQYLNIIPSDEDYICTEITLPITT